MVRLLLVLCAVSAPALAQADLARAQKLLTARRFGEAARVLEAGVRAGNRSAGELRRLLTLRAVALAEINQPARAAADFELLLALEPDFALTAAASPAVANALRTARKAARGKLEFVADPALLDATGQVVQIAARLKGDPTKAARRVRFHLRADGQSWVELEVELDGSFATAGTEAQQVEWWAELLTEQRNTLLTLGSPQQPIHEGKGQPAKVEAPPEAEPAVDPKRVEPPSEPKPPPDAPVAEVKPPLRLAPPAEPQSPPLETRGPTGRAPLRPVGIGLLAAGAAAAGVGLYFGITAQQARSQLSSPVRDSTGRVTSPSQADAFALDAVARDHAVVANVLFGAGGGLAAAGILCLVLGRDVVVAPLPGGTSVSGRF